MYLERPNCNKDKELRRINRNKLIILFIFAIKMTMKCIWKAFLRFWFPSEFQWGQLSECVLPPKKY